MFRGKYTYLNVDLVGSHVFGFVGDIEASFTVIGDLDRCFLTGRGFHGARERCLAGLRWGVDGENVLTTNDGFFDTWAICLALGRVNLSTRKMFEMLFFIQPSH